MPRPVDRPDPFGNEEVETGSLRHEWTPKKLFEKLGVKYFSKTMLRDSKKYDFGSNMLRGWDRPLEPGDQAGIRYPKDLDIGVKNSIVRENNAALEQLIKHPKMAEAINGVAGRGAYEYLMQIYPDLNDEGKLNLYMSLGDVQKWYEEIEEDQYWGPINRAMRPKQRNA